MSKRFLNYLVIAVLLLVVAVAAAGDSNFTNIVTSGDITAGDDLGVTDDMTVTGLVTVGETLGVTGITTLSAGVTQASGAIENIGNLPTWASAVVGFATATDVFVVGASETWVVHNVLVNVTTNYDCDTTNCTMIIGPGTDPNGFIILDDTELQIATTEGTGWAAGWMGQLAATTGALLITNQDFVMAATDGIDMAIGGTNPAAGAATVWIYYTRLD